MKTGIKHKALAILTAFLMVFVMMPATALADDGAPVWKIREGETVDEVPSGEYVENHGTIIINNGNVLSNYGDITTNNGTVEDNSGAIDTNNGTVNDNVGSNGNGGSITNNNGTVNDNGGTITNNNRKVSKNSGYIEYNYAGTIYKNLEAGRVRYNEEHSYIDKNLGSVYGNKGTVATNEGEIEFNLFEVHTNAADGTVKTNRGRVSSNVGTIEINDNLYGDEIVNVNHGRIQSNKSLVQTNSGTVDKNEKSGTVVNHGTVTNNSGEVYEVNGTVTNKSTGTEYFGVVWSDADHTAVSSNDLKEYDDAHWIGEVGGQPSTAAITLTPEYGYEIKEVDGLPTNVSAVKNTDGTWTLTIVSGQRTTIEVPEATAIVSTVTVNNGEGGGEYEAGASVTITANAPENGKQFKEWIGAEGLTFASGSAATTTPATFTMPAEAVTVTATYEDIPSPPVETFTVTVNNGEGGGEYEAGASVTITANAPENGKQFKEWTGAEGLTFASGSSATTTPATFTMPAEAVTVTAIYEDIPAPPEPQDPVSIQDAEVVLSRTAFTYNGAVQKPEIETIDGKTLTEGMDYEASWSNGSSKNAGTYTVTITGKGDYTGTAEATYKINKAANPLKVSAKTATVRYSKLKKKTQTLAVTKVIRFTKKVGDKKSYTLSSAKKGSKSYKKYFKISKASGTVIVKKGLKKGTYKIKVKVKALGSSNYNASTVKTVTFTIKVN